MVEAPILISSIRIPASTLITMENAYQSVIVLHTVNMFSCCLNAATVLVTRGVQTLLSWNMVTLRWFCLHVFAIIANWFMNTAEHFHSSLLLLVGIGGEEFLTLALVLKRKIMASSYATHILPVFLWLHF